MIFGIILFVAGLLLTFSQRLPFRLGRLPGDLAYEKNGVSFFIPITTMILLSALLSLAAWAVSRFKQ
ncbi:MAG: DUF2905 domain-containing protein [Armatimonadota bacterium]